MDQHKRIFIIGHSGAGKGVLAQSVAKELGWKFIDTDFSLEPSIGLPMVEILGAEGQEKFQQCLSEILANQLKQENIVVTTDDSIINSDKGRQLLASEFTVYLKVSTPVQLERISHNRPLLPRSDYKYFLDKFHHERDALYEKVATLTLNSDENALQEHALSIVKAIKK